MTATHKLESRGQESSAGLTQQGMAATHILESRGQESSAGFKHSKAWQSLTSWRAEDRHHQHASNTARHVSHSLAGEQRTGIISRLQTQQGMAATHQLESRGQASSAGLNTARHDSHSLTGEQRTGIISRLQTQQGMSATHKLESRGQASSAGFKHSKACQPLTN